jgi:hypothetical protein
VSPAEQPKCLIVERLDADRDAAHTAVGEGAKPLRFGGIGIGLECHLEGVARAPQPLRGRDHRRRGVGLHQRRRSAAEKDADEFAIRQTFGPGFERHDIGIAKCALVDALTDVAVEVAVRALRNAERPVDVKCERAVGGKRTELGGVAGRDRHHRSPNRASSLANARARWLIACFASGSISPKVMGWPSGTKIGS